MRQAVVIIHGIGEQRPMATLRSFVIGAFGSREKTMVLEDFVFSKPDRVDTTLELRRLSALTKERIKDSPLEKGCETDFYELYWQHLMPAATWSSVLTWIFDLGWNHKLPKAWRSACIKILILLLALVAAVATLAVGIFVCLDGRPLLESLTVLGVSVFAVLGWLGRKTLKSLVLDEAQRFFLGYVGDAARYLTPAPPNIMARRDIRTAGLALLRGLHDDELRRYERIILVGHSLGSVIAYDLITWFWQERHHRQEAERPDGGQEAAAMHHAIPKQGDDDRSLLTEQLEVAPCSKAFPASQWSLWLKMRGPEKRDQKPPGQEPPEEGHRLPWRITDLVTLGSPLAHAEVLLAASQKAFNEGIMQREFPTCPPHGEDPRDHGHLGRTFQTKDGSRYVHILHHGAPFAVTRWTNLYFSDGDIIGGPVARLFGLGIRDVALPAAPEGWLDRLHPAYAHARYWSSSASTELCNALRLNDPSGQSDGAPKEPGTPT